MKKIFLSLVISTIVLLIGCEKNSTTNPVSPNSIDKNAPSTGITSSNTIRGSIPLDRILVVPGTVNSDFLLSGTINYADELVKPDPRMAPSRLDFKIDISIIATLTNTDTGISSNERNRWDISSESEDFVYVSPEGIHILEKSYPVLGRIDNLNLVCIFIVTTNGVGLSNVALKVPDNTEGN